MGLGRSWWLVWKEGRKGEVREGEGGEGEGLMREGRGSRAERGKAMFRLGLDLLLT